MNSRFNVIFAFTVILACAPLELTRWKAGRRPSRGVWHCGKPTVHSPDEAYANPIATKATATHPKTLARAGGKAPEGGRPTFHSTKGESSPAQWTLPITVGRRLGSLLNLMACSTKYLTSVFPNLSLTAVSRSRFSRPTQENGIKGVGGMKR